MRGGIDLAVVVAVAPLAAWPLIAAPGSPAAWLGGAALLAVLPGFALVAAFFPASRPFVAQTSAPSPLEWIALTIGLTIALVALASTSIVALGMSLDLVPHVLVASTWVSAAIAFARRRRSPPTPGAPTLHDLLRRFDLRAGLLLVVVILVATAVLLEAQRGDDSPPFAELSILPADRALVDLVDPVEPSESAPFLVSAQNRARTTLQTSLRVVWTDATDPTSDPVELLSEPIALAPDERIERRIEWIAPSSDGTYRIRASLDGPQGELVATLRVSVQAAR